MVVMTPRDRGPLRRAAEFRKQLGGTVRNVAVGLAKLGRDVAWFGRLGADPHGRYVEAFVRGETSTPTRSCRATVFEAVELAREHGVTVTRGCSSGSPGTPESPLTATSSPIGACASTTLPPVSQANECGRANQTAARSRRWMKAESRSVRSVPVLLGPDASGQGVKRGHVAHRVRADDD